jgi:hypothetical protein
VRLKLKKRKCTSPFPASQPGEYADEFRKPGYIVEKKAPKHHHHISCGTAVVARRLM